MAVDFCGQDITAISAEDMTGKRFQPVSLDERGSIITPPVEGSACIGILQNEPCGEGKIGRVRINGVSKVVVGRNAPAGTEMSVAPNGRALWAAKLGDHVIAILIEPTTDEIRIVRALVVHYRA